MDIISRSLLSGSIYLNCKSRGHILHQNVETSPFSESKFWSKFVDPDRRSGKGDRKQDTEPRIKINKLLLLG